MPLIIITGTPCSGKTYRAQQIAQEFQTRINAFENDSKRSVIYLTSHHASLDPPAEDVASYKPPDQSSNPRDSVYDLARLEKIARAEEFSAIKRAISKNAVVIADAPNYIKGFRYQLFCEAKAAGTRSVVVHTASREDECLAWNNARLETWGWSTTAEDEDTSKNGSMISGPKIGKDVLGDFEPESHTAIYGDKPLNEETRSRSSSMGAANSDHDEDERARRSRNEDTVTLKSLYISDPPETTTSRTEPSLTALDKKTRAATTGSPVGYPLPSADPPPPPGASLPYSPRTFKSLAMRYEPPSPFTRWDTPLFTIPSSDPHPPYQKVWDAIFPPAAKSTSKKAQLMERQQARQAQAQAQQESQPENANTETKKAEVEEVRQHAATILPTATAPNALQLLESTTGELVKLILASARSAGAAEGDGGSIPIYLPMPTEEYLMLEVEIPEGVVLSQPALQRLRRKYTQIQRGGIAHGQGYTKGRRGVAEGFLGFLETEWEGIL